MDFQAIEYPNETDCKGQQEAIKRFAYESAKGKTAMSEWGYIKGVDGKCICRIDARIVEFDPTPYPVVTISSNDPNYFPTEE